MEVQLRQMRQRNERGNPNPRFQVAERKSQLYNSNQVPNEFLCPITREIMKDPVVTSDGHSFEREVITQWLRSNNTSPLTNLELDNNYLIPNIALKKRIDDWSQGYKQEMEGGGFFDF